MNFITSLRRELQLVLRIGDRRRLRVLVLAFCGIFGFGLGWLGMQFQGVPEPVDALDYARLLMAETFASGRLVNPPLPEAMFFLTRMVINSPVYAAAIAPGASLFLSCGYWLGDPVYGLYITIGAAAWSVAWMVCASMSLRWGVLAALWFSLWYGFLSYWGQSYGGEAATIFGVCLHVGGLVRWIRRRRPLDLALAAAGGTFALLCQPFAVGVLVFALTLALIKYFEKRAARWALIGIVASIAGAMACWGALNYATTNDVRRGAPTEYREQYDRNPRYLWQRPRKAPDYALARMERYDFMMAERISAGPINVGRLWYDRLMVGLEFLIGLPVILLLLLFGGTWWFPSFNLRGIVYSSALTGVALLVIKIDWTVSDWAVVVPALILALAFLGRSVAFNRMHEAASKKALIVILAAIFPLLTYARGLARVDLPAVLETHASYRSRIAKHLRGETGSGHLVMVRYDEAVPVEVEYVYNGANISTQHIIWTHFIEPHDADAGRRVSAGIQGLIDAFPGRRLWVLSVGVEGVPTLREFNWQPSQSG